MATRNLFFVTGGVDHLFSNSQNWSLSNGGAGGQPKPTIDDNMIFTDQSPAMLLDEHANVKTVATPSSDLGNGFDLNGFNLTVEGSFGLGQGAWVLGSGVLTIGNSIAGSTAHFGYSPVYGTLDASGSTILLKNVTQVTMPGTLFHNIEMAPGGSTVLIDNDFYMGDFSWDGYWTINGGTVKYMGNHNFITHHYVGNDPNPLRLMSGSDIDTNSLAHEHQPIFNFSPSSALTMNMSTNTAGANMEWRMSFTPTHGTLEVLLQDTLKITEMTSPYVVGASAFILRAAGHDIIGPVGSNYATLNFNDAGVGSILDLSTGTPTIQMQNISTGSNMTVLQGSSIIDMYSYFNGMDWTGSFGIFGAFTTGAAGEVRLSANTVFSNGHNLGGVTRKNDGTGYAKLLDQLSAVWMWINDKMDFNNNNVNGGNNIYFDAAADVKGNTGNAITTGQLQINAAATIVMGTAVWHLGNPASGFSINTVSHRVLYALTIVPGSPKQTFDDYFSVTNAFTASPGAELEFADATASPFAAGSLVWNGTRVNPIRVHGVSGVWKLNVTGGPATVTHVIAENSNASFGSAITDTAGQDKGGNSNWSISALTVSSPVFSVGTYTGNLSSGGTMSITSGVLTFSVPQVHPGLGVGDIVGFNDTERVYLKSKISTSVWNVVDVYGEVPDDAASTTIDSISRVFYTLARALEYGSSPMKGIGLVFGTNDLVGALLSPTLYCYADYRRGGIVDNETVLATGYLTDATANVIIFVASPANTTTECNERQQHVGLKDTGYKVSVGTVAVPVLDFDGVCANVGGIDVDGVADIGIRMSGPNVPVITLNQRIAQCVVRNQGSYGVRFLDGVVASIGHSTVWNSVIYGQTVANVRHQGDALEIVQSVIHGGQKGVQNDSLGATFWFLWSTTFGHSVKDFDITPTSLLDILGEDAFFGTISRTYKITQSYKKLFYGYLTGDYRVRNSDSQAYLTGVRDDVGFDPELFDPDLAGTPIPAFGSPINIGAFSGLFSLPFDSSMYRGIGRGAFKGAL
jgi:hypothetical protein